MLIIAAWRPSLHSDVDSHISHSCGTTSFRLVWQSLLLILVWIVHIETKCIARLMQCLRALWSGNGRKRGWELKSIRMVGFDNKFITMTQSTVQCSGFYVWMHYTILDHKSDSGRTVFMLYACRTCRLTPIEWQTTDVSNRSGLFIIQQLRFSTCWYAELLFTHESIEVVWS